MPTVDVVPWRAMPTERSSTSDWVEVRGSRGKEDEGVGVADDVVCETVDGVVKDIELNIFVRGAEVGQVRLEVEGLGDEEEGGAENVRPEKRSEGEDVVVVVEGMVEAEVKPSAWKDVGAVEEEIGGEVEDNKFMRDEEDDDEDEEGNVDDDKVVDDVVDVVPMFRRSTTLGLAGTEGAKNSASDVVLVDVEEETREGEGTGGG